MELDTLKHFLDRPVAVLASIFGGVLAFVLFFSHHLMFSKLGVRILI